MRILSAAVVALCLTAGPSAAEFYWEGLLPFVKRDVRLSVRGMDCSRGCPQSAASQGASQAARESDEPPPRPGEGELEWLAPDTPPAR